MANSSGKPPAPQATTAVAKPPDSAVPAKTEEETKAKAEAEQEATAKADALTKIRELESQLQDSEKLVGDLESRLEVVRRAKRAAPIARAVSALLEARDCLLEAERARGKDDSTADAGRLAEAILAFGGAIAHEQEPWPIKHALDRTPGVADPNGAAALEKLAALVGSCLRQGAWRRSLGLGPQLGLASFAKVAVKHRAQRHAVEELHQARRDEETLRQRRHVADLSDPRRRAGAGSAPNGPSRSSDFDEETDDDVNDEGDDSPRVG